MGKVTSNSASPLTEQQERDLVVRCQSGDVTAMEQIVRQYQGWVYNIAYGKIGNPEDAKDITQDVFLSVWQNIGQFQFRSRFSTWLYRVVVSRYLNEERKRRQRKTTPMEIDDAQPWTPVDTTSPAKAVLDKEQDEILQNALARLKERHREILMLRIKEGLSYEQLSEVLGCSVGRVKSRLYEARQALRKIIKQIGGD